MALLIGSRARAAFAVAMLVAAVPVCAAADDPPSAQENWATARARALTEQGIANRNAGAVEQAIARFNEAISIDATYGPAYVALASLREGRGEREEALKVLEMAIERDPSFDEAIVSRADLLARAGRFGEATSSYLELLSRHPNDMVLLEKVLDVAPRGNLMPVALAASRRMAIVAHDSGDAAKEKRARTFTRALERLVAEADPVRRGASSSDRVRRALARTWSR